MDEGGAGAGIGGGIGGGKIGKSNPEDPCVPVLPVVGWVVPVLPVLPVPLDGGAAFNAARSATPFGLPSPVTASQPGPAL